MKNKKSNLRPMPKKNISVLGILAGITIPIVLAAAGIKIYLNLTKGPGKKPEPKNRPAEVYNPSQSQRDPLTRLILRREKYTSKYTTGVLYEDTNESGKVDNGDLILCDTLELSWEENKKYKSCIPEGDYDLEPDTSTKLGRVFNVRNVPDRTDIIIHQGGSPEKTDGCILVGIKKREGYLEDSFSTKRSLLRRYDDRRRLKLKITNRKGLNSLVNSSE